jgi:5-methylcytosine-specific restriction endonuclease McrA
VRRAVWKRDQGRCIWPLDSGGICGSTRRVELDHIVPRALGGPSTADNCRLICRVHNDLAARLVFGNAQMDQYTSGPGARARF